MLLEAHFTPRYFFIHIQCGLREAETDDNEKAKNSRVPIKKKKKMKVSQEI